MEVVIASIREPSDFGGLPIINDGDVILSPPVWAKRLAQAGRGILFLDEISTAPPAVQAALLRVVLDRVVGDLVSDPPWHVAGPYRGAWKKGFRARLEGLAEGARPYGDVRNARGSVTFSRGFRKAWLEGWRAADQAFA